jgi:hypothetical protein
MSSFRDNGLDLTVKEGFNYLSTPTGDRITIFATTNDSTAARYYNVSNNLQLWMIDTTGGKHEITNDWLESKVAETSAKLDYIYPAVAAFISAGIIYATKQDQTISGNLNIIGNVATSGNFVMSNGLFVINGPISAYNSLDVFSQFNSNEYGTKDTLEKITPIFIRSSVNSQQPQSWNDPRILLVGNTKIYNEYKQTDRGLRFTAIDRTSYQVIHDEVYDTAGSQTRVAQLAFNLFRYMNGDTFGILNSKGKWENLLIRNETAETYGMSARDISGAYQNLQIGSVLDQFNRLGLLKGIRGAFEFGADSISGNASQYCAIFESSGISVDTCATSSVLYPSYRVAESLISKVKNFGANGNEVQRAQLAGWFIKPRNLAPDFNVIDNKATFVVKEHGKEVDAIKEIVFVTNKATNANPYNVKINGYELNKLSINFGGAGTLTVSGATFLKGILNVSGAMTVNSSGDFSGNYVTGVKEARSNVGTDAVNVAFLNKIVPIGAQLDYAGDYSTVPTDHFLPSDWGTHAVSAYPELFNIIHYTFCHGMTGDGSTFRTPDCRYAETIGINIDTSANGFPAIQVGDTMGATSGPYLVSYTVDVSGRPIGPAVLRKVIGFNKIIRYR